MNMTKRIIFILTVFCTLQAQANVQPSREDTVRYNSLYSANELLQPMQPAYLDGVILPKSRSGNWFVTLGGGTTAFLGTPLGCEDLFGRLKPSYSLALGRWFTPSVGARINYSGLKLKDAQLSTQDYHYVHADLLWNVLGGRYAMQEDVRWSLAPFAGVGLLHNPTSGHNPFAISYGIQGQYRISKRVSGILELSNTTTFQDFDGYGRANRPGDHLLSLTAGLTFHLGKVGWKRVMDVTPYIIRNEQLVEYANTLAEENRRYAGQHDRDSRTLAELKKILEIEGLLDTYSHLFEQAENLGNTFPVNNYSGLNSLRARLQNRHWSGNSPLDTMAVQNGDNIQASLQNAVSEASNTLVSDSTALIHAGNDYIGVPIYFFFKLNTAHLTDESQKLNLDELARVAKKYDLSVRVTGAADSSTGTSDINKSLSTLRAGVIAAELELRGVPGKRITKAGKGGIADHTPIEANRHTRVELYFPESE